MLYQKISAMLAHAAADPFDSPDHLYEIKWDGTRCILFADEIGIRQQNRTLLTFPFDTLKLHPCIPISMLKM